MLGLHLGHGRFLSTTGQRVFGLGILILLLAFLGHAPALVLLGLVVALLPVASVLLCGRDLSGIGVVGSVDVPQLVVGGTAPLALEFSGAVEDFLVTFTAPHVETEPLWVRPEHGRAEAVVALVGRSHGFFTEALIELEHAGPWGLSASRARAVMQLPPWPIVPSTRRVPAPADPGLPVPDGDNSGAGRAATSGHDPRGMRAFRAADEPRAVNWRATARTGTLTVREWDPPSQIPGVLIVPVLPGSGYPDPVRAALPAPPAPPAPPALPAPPAPPAFPAQRRTGESAELLLGALGSLGLAAAAEDRRLSLHFYGTVRTANGTALTPPGRLDIAHVWPEDLLATLAGVRPETPTSVAAVARAAAAGATPGCTVLLGLDLGNVAWTTEDLVQAHAVIATAGCQLEVVIALPPWGLRPEVLDAFATLATRCPVTPVDAFVTVGDDAQVSV